MAVMWWKRAQRRVATCCAGCGATDGPLIRRGYRDPEGATGYGFACTACWQRGIDHDRDRSRRQDR